MSVITKEGYLEKMGTLFFPKRYFILQSNLLVELDKKPVGGKTWLSGPNNTFNLNRATVTDPSTGGHLHHQTSP